MTDRRQARQDRRSAPRAPLHVAVAKRVGAGIELAQASNIGPLGMTLRHAGQECLPETPVSLLFELPDGEPLLAVRGEVVFDRPDGAFRTAGVRFADLRPEDARRIERFVGLLGGPPPAL